MADEQLIEQIAELLFNHEDIDSWNIYDSLENLFKKERPQMKIKYDEVFRDNELKQREEHIEHLKQQIQQLEKEMQLIKEKY